MKISNVMWKDEKQLYDSKAEIIDTTVKTSLLIRLSLGSNFWTLKSGCLVTEIIIYSLGTTNYKYKEQLVI